MYHTRGKLYPLESGDGSTYTYVPTYMGVTRAAAGGEPQQRHDRKVKKSLPTPICYAVLPWVRGKRLRCLNLKIWHVKGKTDRWKRDSKDYH